jgi:integrase
MTDLVIGTSGSRVDLALAGWLDAKSKRSGSIKTWRAYADAMRSFRGFVQGHGLDLDGDVAGLALAAQAWAGRGTPAPATYNQRLAILSSFYRYACTHGLLPGDNPIIRVERRLVQQYAGAHALDYGVLKAQLRRIDRATLHGKRDYALLSVALSTGRRVAELATLRWRDVRVMENSVTIHWTRTKGGKQARDILPTTTGAALLVYLHAFYGAELGMLAPTAPVWVSLSRRNYGQAMTTQTIADICAKHLSTSRVHALRHTFARAMEDAGAKVSEIQARLGHNSLATTGRYLAALRQADNAHAEVIAGMLGIEE